uniref:Uncharacterized protein n=1 Tax=Amphimedon queenslandica TaxID=400682 RepID=A0A1X7ULQ9_AMPQE
MFTMSSFDPALIFLVNIYADEFGVRQDTKVYSNGAMQVSIFISVNYNGDTDNELLEQIKGYVQDNVVIYTLDDGKVELDLDEWKKSTEENSFYHDINHAGNNSSGPDGSDIRVPLYFTVPVASEGEHRWIAKLDEEETSTSTPVTITVVKFSATIDDLEIVDKDATYCNQLRVVKYKDKVFPDVQKLVKLLEYKGIKFLSSAESAWVSMVHSNKGHKIGAFIEYKLTEDIRIAKPGHEYWSHEMIKQDIPVGTGDKNILHCDCCDDSLDFTSAQVEKVWNEGIAMFMAYHMSLYIHDGSGHNTNFDCNEFLAEDNFGNRINLHFNWDS